MLRYFEDIGLGEELRTPGRTITEADVVGFAAISGEHEGLDFSRGAPGRPARVPDLLVMVIISGLGFRVPRPQLPILAFMVLDWQPVQPVLVGDTVHCRLRVVQKRPMKDGGVIVEKRQVVNQRGEVVQESEYKLLVARRPTIGSSLPPQPPSHD